MVYTWERLYREFSLMWADPQWLHSLKKGKEAMSLVSVPQSMPLLYSAILSWGCTICVPSVDSTFTLSVHSETYCVMWRKLSMQTKVKGLMNICMVVFILKLKYVPYRQTYSHLKKKYNWKCLHLYFL